MLQSMEFNNNNTAVNYILEPPNPIIFDSPKISLFFVTLHSVRDLLVMQSVAKRHAIA